MKNKAIYIYASLFLLIIIFSNHAYAQETDDSKLNYLTEKQKQLLHEQQDLLDKIKATLKENLTKEQLTQLKNKNLTKEERTKLLRKSLNQQQRDIINENRSLLKTKRIAFRNSLTKRQKLQLRRFLRTKSIKDRRRIVRRLRRLIRDNLDR